MSNAEGLLHDAERKIDALTDQVDRLTRQLVTRDRQIGALNVDTHAMMICLADALGVTGLDFDGMIDLVRDRSMLAQVRETRGDQHAHVVRKTHGGFRVIPGDGSAGSYGEGDTEHAALQSALEASP